MCHIAVFLKVTIINSDCFLSNWFGKRYDDFRKKHFANIYIYIIIKEENVCERQCTCSSMNSCFPLAIHILLLSNGTHVYTISGKVFRVKQFTVWPEMYIIKSLVSRITVSLIACRAGSKLSGTKKQPLDFGIRVRIWQITTFKTDDSVVNLRANATIPSANSSATQPLHKSFVPMSIRTTFGASARTAPNSLNKPSKVSPPYLGRQPSQTYVKGGGRDSNSVVLDHQGRLAAAYDARNCERRRSGQ